MTATALIVMETGSDWPGQVGDGANVVIPGNGEDLLRRTQQTLDALSRSKERVRIAVLACNEAVGGAAQFARAQLARVLLLTVSRALHGRLVLTARGGATHEVRQELLALAGALTEELPGGEVTISVRFAEPRCGQARTLTRDDAW